jgi:hypothetical protein
LAALGFRCVFDPAVCQRIWLFFQHYSCLALTLDQCWTTIMLKITGRAQHPTAGHKNNNEQHNAADNYPLYLGPHRINVVF